jgi:hypothetical protein
MWQTDHRSRSRLLLAVAAFGSALAAAAAGGWAAPGMAQPTVLAPGCR